MRRNERNVLDIDIDPCAVYNTLESIGRRHVLCNLTRKTTHLTIKNVVLLPMYAKKRLLGLISVILILWVDLIQMRSQGKTPLCPYVLQNYQQEPNNMLMTYMFQHLHR